MHVKYGTCTMKVNSVRCTRITEMMMMQNFFSLCEDDALAFSIFKINIDQNYKENL